MLSAAAATCTQLCLDVLLCGQNLAYRGRALSCTFSVKNRIERSGKGSCGFDALPSPMPEFTGGQYLDHEALLDLTYKKISNPQNKMIYK